MNSDTATTTRKNITVYFLAAKEDQDDCKAVKKHLTPVVRNSKIPIEIHSDFEIPIGEDTEEYKQKLHEADIVLAFISADYINDDEIYRRTQKVIEKYNKNETIMLPILVRNCLWKSTPFVNLPLLPKNIQPLNNKQFWNSEDDALTSVVNDINEAISSFTYEETVKAFSEMKPKEVPEQKTERPAPTSEPLAAFEEPVQKEIPVQETIIEKPKTTIKANVPLEVDWRKGYYKNVIWKRGAAYLLDQFLVLLPAFFLYLVVHSIFALIITGSEEVSDAEANSIIIFGFSFYLLVCAFMESSKWRGTPGKMLLKLQITDREGNSISFFRALWRNIARLIVGYLYLFILPLIVQIFTFQKSKKLFHDWATSTVIGEKLSKL